jgi:hypothetical protein
LHGMCKQNFRFRLKAALVLEGLYGRNAVPPKAPYIVMLHQENREWDFDTHSLVNLYDLKALFRRPPL